MKTCVGCHRQQQRPKKSHCIYLNSKQGCCVFDCACTRSSQCNFADCGIVWKMMCDCVGWKKTVASKRKMANEEQRAANKNPPRNCKLKPTGNNNDTWCAVVLCYLFECHVHSTVNAFDYWRVGKCLSTIDAYAVPSRVSARRCRRNHIPSFVKPKWIRFKVAQA